MNRVIDLRLRKLEAQETGDISIWCDDAAEVPSTIDQMIADGELLEVDRPRCVHWQLARGTRAGAHEQSLEELE
jgi:hypothetical protein